MFNNHSDSSSPSKFEQITLWTIKITLWLIIHYKIFCKHFWVFVFSHHFSLHTLVGNCFHNQVKQWKDNAKMGKHEKNNTKTRKHALCEMGLWDWKFHIFSSLNLYFFVTGELLVYPGSIVHLDCLYKRKLGNPEWILTDNNGKSYPTGQPKKSKYIGNYYLPSGSPKSSFTFLVLL